MGRGRSKGSGGSAKSGSKALTAAKKSGTIEDDKYKNLKVFNDKANGTHTYMGLGDDVDDFFNKNSNFNSLITQMSKSDRAGFRSWCSGCFMNGQQYRGWDNLTRQEKAVTAMYDKYLDQATLTKGIEVSRRTDAQLILGAGHKKATLAQLQAMEGQRVISRGNMSFGAASEGLTIGQSGKNVELKLKIPSGTVGAGMYIGDGRINAWGNRQREFITNRDIVMRVGKTTYNKSRGIYEVEIFYENRLQHDYGTKGHP